ncbi:MAG: hypothetical protein P1V81_01455 [Planctomycetota bacterium]|nr:hypothetical protein [Planctomycetota bacterium]
MISTILALSLGATSPATATPLPQLGLWTQAPAVTAQGLWSSLQGPGGPGGQGLAVASACDQTAMLQAMATLSELQDDYLVHLAVAANELDPIDSLQVTLAAYKELLEGLELASDVFDMRTLLCSKLGGVAYDPDLEPADFSSTITNPYLPYRVGASWTYHQVGDEGLEVIVVTVLPETRTIEGVECRVVRDTVELNGELIEDTWDYYAQHADGSVWYFGELSFNYEDGYIADIEGSWITGVDDAKPGIVMQGAPSAGQVYRQEYLISEAEDAAQILSTSSSVVVPAGSFTGCVKTLDVVPLDPEAIESKYFARGVGFVLEVDEGTGDLVELVSYTMP